MLACFARAAILGFALLAGLGAAAADGLADFNDAVEKASAHNRAALGYLRTGNTDLASLEIDRLRVAWGEVSERFSGKRPEAFDGNSLYVTAMTDIAMRLVAADMLFNAGRPEAVRQSLSAIRDDLYNLRKSAGIVVLADCVHDADAAMDALMVYNDRSLDLSKADTKSAVASKASAYGHVLDRCDGIASETVRKNPEFRRLIDGAKASLALVPNAITTRDAGLLHRVLIELRSFENLLAFRFG
jgi:hypothetical protein